MSFRVVLVILCLTGFSYASWLCPVYRADISGLIESESSENLAVLKSWYATIQPVFVENATMSDYADWDYTVSERLVLVPPVSGCDILICLDLGAAPELTRELESFWVNGVLMEPRSTPLFRLLDSHYEEFRNVYDERFSKRYGFRDFPGTTSNWISGFLASRNR